MNNRPDHTTAAAGGALRPRVARRADAERPVPLSRPLAEQLGRVVPTAILTGIAGALAWATTGSIAARDWLPYALLGALVLAAAVLTSRTRPGRAGAFAIGGLLALAALDAFSFAWSPSPGLARDEGLLVLFYVVTLAAALITVREEIDRAYALGIVALGASALTLAAALKLVAAGHPADNFFGGRLDFPISYVNAQAAFMLLGFWPALVTAARRTAPIAVRALALGGATALLAGWLLTQSKGGALGLILSAVVVFAVARDRLRLAVPTFIAAALAAAGSVPLTAPIRSSTTAMLNHAIHRGATVLLVLAIVGVAVGGLYAIVDGRLELNPTSRRAAGRIALLGLVAALVVGSGAFIAKEHSPFSWVSKQWASFKQNPSQSTSGTHLLVIGSNRYDFWRVGLDRFASHPILGVGARGFASEYLLDRKSEESPARSHSLFVDVLSETGIVGFLLLLLAIGVPLLAAARRARMELAAAGALGGAVLFLGHASVDWIWTFPAVGLPFFLLLGIGASSGVRRAHRLRLKLVIPAVVGVTLIGLVAFGAPWLSARYADRALKGGAGAANDLSWAKRLDPLAIDPWIKQSLIARTPQERVAPLQHAVGMEPRNYALHYLLGFAYLQAGKALAGYKELIRSAQLDPHDPFVAAAVPQPVVPSAPARPPRGN